MRSLLIAVILVLFGALPAAWGQEPSYTVTFAGNQRLHIAVSVTDGPDGRTIGLANRATGGEPDTFLLDMTLRLDADGLPISAYSRFQPKATPQSPILLEAKRGMPDPDGNTTYDLRVPVVRGTLPYSGTLVTETTLILFAGRLYDWQKGGEQSFSYLLDYAATVPTIHSLKLTANGTEEITLESGSVRARRLTYETALPTLPTNQRKGTLYVGPHGEVLRLDAPLILQPVKMKGPAEADATARTITLAVDAPGRIMARAKPQPGGQIKAQLAIEVDYEIASVLTDARFNPMHVESILMGGRKLTAEAGVGGLNYQMDAGDATNVSVSAGKPLFFPQWFLCDTWEGDMKVGDKRDGAYFHLQNGFPGAYRFTVERMEDTSAALRGESMAVHHYRFAMWTDEKKTKIGNYTDAYTDGKRLIALLGAGNGIRCIRDGWEAYAAALPEPPDPAKAAAPATSK